MLPPAREVYERPGCVGGFIGQQPQNRIGYFDWMSAALHRQGVLDAIHPSWFAAIGVHVRINKPRPYGINPDAFICNLPGKTNGERIDRALRGSVINILSR